MVFRRSRIQEELQDIERKDDVQEKVPSISYFTLYRFASKSDRILITISLLATFVAGVTLPYAITLVADNFQNMISHTKSVQDGTSDDEAFLTKIHLFGVKYSCVGVILFIGGYMGTALMNITALSQVHRIRQAYLRAALNQDFAYYDLRKTGGFASRMADDVIKLEEGIGDKVSALVYSLTIGLGCIIMAMVKGWKLALLCLTTTPVTFLLVGLTGKVANHLSKKQTIASGQASAVAQEVLGSIRTVYSFNGQEKELERYRQPLAVARRTNIKKDPLMTYEGVVRGMSIFRYIPHFAEVSIPYVTGCKPIAAIRIVRKPVISTKKDFFTGLSMGFLFFCVFCSYALSFYIGVYLVIHDPDNYNADVMFSVFFGIMTAMGNIGMVGSLVGTFGAARGAGAQIFHLLDNVPTINPLTDKGIKLVSAEGNLELKNVVFHYPSRPSVPILQGVSITVKRGQSIALVGHSGCGKSTVIQLIGRYYDVIGGSVQLDGHDIRDLSVRWLRARIGLVGQEPVLFNVSVRDNIRYGREEASDDDVTAAAKHANAHNFIVKLPKGYDTIVGERGASLSGGQKQRIAIARALVRNPLVLLLDEATSALDTTSEAKVQIALDKAAEGRTTVVVAHRLSTIRNVDVIYAMKDGKVTEYGSHDELMAKKGQYYDMVLMQEPNAVNGSEDHAPAKQESKISQEAPDKEDLLSVLGAEKDSKTPKLSFWRVVGLNSPEWKSITIGSIGSILLGFSMPLFIVVFGDLFGAMSVPDTNQLWEKVKKVSLTCIIIGVVMGISNLIEAVSFGIAGAYLTERLRVRMFGHMLKQNVAYFDERMNSTGALCARLSAEAAYVQGATGQRIGIFLQGVGSVGLALFLAMYFEWRVGLVALAFFPIIVVVIYHQAKATSKESSGNAKTLECSTKIAVEAVTNIRTVASLGREEKFLAEYTAQLQPTLPLSRRSAHYRGLVAGLSRSMFNFVNAAALTYGGHLVVSDGVACEDILITTQSLQMASGQAQNAFTFAPDFQKGINAASRIVALLKTKTTIFDPAVPAVLRFQSKGEASLKEVEFSYPCRPNVSVLRGLNLMVESGKTIALVGRSGCGKSTVIQLLQRFYDPDTGVVSLDSYPLPSLLISEVRSTFGLVSQEPVLFDLSIRGNIAYGDNSRKPTDDEIHSAARQANIHDFIVSLPMGYDTNIGAKGVQLSGGQKQRVAIARALIRKPKILLLDEATSALDSESEKVVTEALENAREGRTCIVIAHRLSTVRGADCVCVLRAGRVAESGTHDQLLQLNGAYAELHANL